jgi:hypothetical protein
VSPQSSGSFPSTIWAFIFASLIGLVMLF